MWWGRSKIVEDLYAIVVNFLSAKIDYYNYKIFYEIPMVTIKKTSIEGTHTHTQKKSGKEPKHKKKKINETQRAKE